MVIRLVILFFVWSVAICFCFGQEFGHVETEKISLPDSLEINKEIINSINFDINFNNEIVKEEPKSLFLGIDDLPDNHIYLNDYPPVTLYPYNSSVKYNEDPIKGLGKMMSASFNNKQNSLVKVNVDPLRTPYRIGRFSRATSGGAGITITFSMEDILQSIFSKSYRARKYNAKHANAWKHY